MADNKNDITTELNMSDTDRSQMKKDQFAENPETRLARPTQVADTPKQLIPELVEQLKIGRRSSMFSGIERCIRILEPGTPNQRHCLSMMVNDLTRNMRICSQCDRIKDPNANPKVINSSMIKLPQKELEEMGLSKDPSYQAPQKNVPAPAPKRRKAAQPVENQDQPVQRSRKVKTPNKVVIEMTMEELKKDPNVLKVMLGKTLEAIFELPVSNFREAEEIRVVKERVESFLKEGE